ncbi:unnamed protein product [Anisakis simplex]|uniref:Uncharacterized protein n=1 Tax=Anisakis simplex TaxID=6269 RepID=A0A0M3JTP7_ANISI|nr:unnamed protein product [Anisakis simplex]
MSAIEWIRRFSSSQETSSSSSSNNQNCDYEASSHQTLQHCSNGDRGAAGSTVAESSTCTGGVVGRASDTATSSASSTPRRRIFAAKSAWDSARRRFSLPGTAHHSHATGHALVQPAHHPFPFSLHHHCCGDPEQKTAAAAGAMQHQCDQCALYTSHQNVVAMSTNTSICTRGQMNMLNDNIAPHATSDSSLSPSSQTPTTLKKQQHSHAHFRHHHHHPADESAHENVNLVLTCMQPANLIEKTQDGRSLKRTPCALLSSGIEHTKRVTVVDRPGQEKAHYTGNRTRHRNGNAPKQSALVGCRLVTTEVRFAQAPDRASPFGGDRDPDSQSVIPDRIFEDPRGLLATDPTLR